MYSLRCLERPCQGGSMRLKTGVRKRRLRPAREHPTTWHTAMKQYLGKWMCYRRYCETKNGDDRWGRQTDRTPYMCVPWERVMVVVRHHGSRQTLVCERVHGEERRRGG